MNIRKDDTVVCDGPAQDRMFEAEVRRIAAMSREEVKANLRQLGIEPVTSLPQYVYDRITRPVNRVALDKINLVEVFCVLLLLSLGVYSLSGDLFVTLFTAVLLAPLTLLAVKQLRWGPAAGRFLNRRELNDFNLSVERGAPERSRPLTVLLAIVFEHKRLTANLRRTKSVSVGEIYESAIEQLNAGWLAGKGPEVLHDYIETIKEFLADDSAIDDIARLRGRSALAVVKYALGDLREGNRLGSQNWAEALRLESDEESQLKWTASYGYFNSTLFLGDFRKAMNLMAGQWSRYYAPLDDNAKKSLRKSLSGHLILNPVLAIPRHIILAAAFNERPRFEPKFWPSEAVYQELAPEERECKLRWVEAWYEEARRVCQSEPTSLDLSHAYAAFYFTLLLLEPGTPAAYLHDRINQAFDAIDDSPAIVAQYVKFGFRGVYHLVCGEDEQALDHLGQAARLSAVSGNRFADSLFMCSHAVAAARLNRPGKYLEPAVDYYLSKAERLAQKINRPFYKKLCYGAKSAVCQLRGETATARRFAAWSTHGTTGGRILKVFHQGPTQSTRP